MSVIGAHAGEVIGSYRVVRQIGEGGMGAVYLAEHTLLGRPAAIKVLRSELSHRTDLLTRFFNEARAATAVKHPGIVEIYDFGHHVDGSAYLVMEFLEGESLSARMRRFGVLPQQRAIAMSRQICGALAAAHAKGIIHRDLKPDNIFVVRDPDTSDGERTKVLDFGIAKLGGDPAGPSSSMTRTGMVMGTPAYMAPEQCKGAGLVDQRSDLYALGCILFEMVCGRPPFVAEGAGEIMAHHIFTPPPTPSSVAAVSPPLEHVIMRVLAKDADLRFRSAEEMLAALQAIDPSGSHVRTGANAATVMAPGAMRLYPSTPGTAPPGMVPGTAPPGMAPRTGPPGTAPPGYTPLGMPPAGAAPPGLGVPRTVPPAMAQTTMSSAAGATMSPPRKPRSWMLPVAAVAVLAIGGGIVAAVQGGGSRDAAPAVAPPPPNAPAPVAKPPAPAPNPAPAPPAPTAPAAHAEPPVAQPPVAPAPQPAKATLAISSDPDGAEVYRMPQGVLIGTTPLSVPVDAVAGQLVFMVKKAGYRDETIAMAADRDGDQLVKLRKTAAATAPSKPTKPTKPTDGAAGTDDFLTRTPAAPSGSLDPFAKPKKSP